MLNLLSAKADKLSLFKKEFSELTTKLSRLVAQYFGFPGPGG